MTDISTYGTLLKKTATYDTPPYVTIGEVVTIAMPELKNPTVESTHQSSGGKREFVPGNLAELAEFSATVNYVVTTVSGIIADCKAGTLGSYQITFPTGGSLASWAFDAYVVGFKPADADAQAPEAFTADVTFRPTGQFAVN